MATFVICTRCGRTEEVTAIDEVPLDWHRTLAELICARCTGKDEDVNDVIDEEVIYPSSGEIQDTFDEGYCEVCDGPCQGH